MISRNDIKIKIKLLNSENLLAQATVILFGSWEEHGWKILKSNRVHPTFQEEIWIQSPSYKSFGEWKDIVFIDDRELYELVQEKIYDAYHMARSKKQGQESAKEKKSEEEINIDEIPI
jgi:DNA-binding cell septation regulator SpoVG